MSGNGDYGVVREHVLADARERARALASQGLPAHEIEHRLERDLTASERELLWGIAKHEVAAARTDQHQQQGFGGPSMPSPSEPGDTVPVPPAVRERWQARCNILNKEWTTSGKAARPPTTGSCANRLLQR